MYSRLVRRAWRMLHLLRERPRGLRPSVISYNAVAHACARAAAAAPADKMRKMSASASARHGHGGTGRMWRPGGGEDEEAEGGDDDLSSVFARGRLLEEMLKLEELMREDGVAADLRSFSTILHGTNSPPPPKSVVYSDLLIYIKCTQKSGH
jgi:hypothetical protein